MSASPTPGPWTYGTRKDGTMIIGVSLRTLDRWDRVGAFRAVRIGKAKRYHAATIAKVRP